MFAQMLLETLSASSNRTVHPERVAIVSGSLAARRGPWLCCPLGLSSEESHCKCKSIRQKHSFCRASILRQCI
jgi:hypothetical protein